MKMQEKWPIAIILIATDNDSSHKPPEGWVRRKEKGGMMEDTKIKILKQELNIAKRRIRKLVSALIWTTGSDDFAPGGKARKGWLKAVLPLLQEEDKIRRRKKICTISPNDKKAL